MTKILEKHNISLHEGTRKVEFGDKTKDHDERFHALKVGFSKSHAFLIDSRAYNHMVASKNHSLHYNLLMVQVITWYMTLKSKLKKRVQSS